MKAQGLYIPSVHGTNRLSKGSRNRIKRRAPHEMAMSLLRALRSGRPLDTALMRRQVNELAKYHIAAYNLLKPRKEE